MSISPVLARASLLLIAATLVGLALSACTRWSSNAPDPKQPPPASPRVVEGNLAITNVTVIDVADGTARPGMTVVVNGERIVAVEPSAGVRPSESATVIDGTGKFLIPGLWDMHVHLIDPSFPGLFTKHGVTAVRHMFSLNPLYTYEPPADPKTGSVHPRVVAANQILDGPDTGWKGFVGRNAVIAKDADSARAAVRELKRRGNDFVKVYAALPRDAYLAAIDEAKLLGMDVAGHVPHGVSAGEASDAGQRTIEHLDGVAIACSSLESRLRAQLTVNAKSGAKPDAATGWRAQAEAHDSFDERKADTLIAKFRANGTWHVPTLVQTRAMARLGDRAALDPAAEETLPEVMRVFWQREFPAGGGVKLPRLGIALTRTDLADRQRLFEGDRALVSRLHRAGVPLLAGTDTPAPLVVPGLALHEELALLVECGLTPAEALRTATLNPAVCLRREHDLGTVSVGKYADLVLLSANPLENIRNTRAIEAVWIGGRTVDR